MHSQEPQPPATRHESRGSARHADTAAQIDGVLDLLDELWSTARRHGLMHIAPTQLAAELRRVSVAARDAKVLPEHFLWIVKETWSALPEVRTAADPDKAREQLSGIVTLCIHEYYRD